MKISKYINRPITGFELESWNYDESLSSIELKQIGYPYSMRCIEINEYSIIAVDTGEDSPFDFYEKNKNNEFFLNASIHPRKSENSFLREKNIFYATKSVKKQFNENVWSVLTINLFKENGSLSGAIENGSFSAAMIDVAFAKINEKIQNLDYEIKKENLHFEEIGSTYIQIEFLNEEPHTKLTFKTKGITAQEIQALINHIYGNIPDNQK